jgi:5-methyltetrahydrofolate--homocysteine methyltransferase
MASLLYREDFDQVRDRLTTWWQGGDISRPAVLLTGTRPAPLEDIPAQPEPPGWVTHYSTRDFGYRVHLAAAACTRTCYWGDAVPMVAPDLGPDCLALYLGCAGVETPGTVWFRPCIATPENARFAFDSDSFYWDFTLRLSREQLRLGQGKFLLQFPDLIEGLDTLAAMRGTQDLLVDLLERPAWVHRCLRQITDLYYQYYDVLYDLMKDDRGGSHFWAWAPGRMAKFQCDFSAMISPAMFGEFMAPVLREMCSRMDHCMYHWDGPGAIPHHDHLLSIPDLDMLQWTPGAGIEPIMDRRWWPLYHKTIEAGKKVALLGFSGLDNLCAFKKEFGPKLKQCMISMHAESFQQAEEILRLVSD